MSPSETDPTNEEASNNVTNEAVLPSAEPPIAEPRVEHEQTTQPDFLLPSLFAAAATLILARQDPINLRFEPNLPLTLGVAALGIAVLGLGLWRKHKPLIFAGTGILFANLTAGVVTQPYQFNIPIAAIWPLRLALVLLVVCAWAFLMSPTRWLRRALMAFVLPTVLALAFWGGPSTLIQLQLFPEITAKLFGNIYPPFLNFAPYWLAVDSKGTLYATDNNGSIVWVFDSSGNAKGMLFPGRAPAVVSTPGPGILPPGYENEAILIGTGIYGTPTPVGMIAPRFDFCGLAIDPQDNVYMIDLVNPDGYKLLRFDSDGYITARWSVPSGYEPTSACLAADDNHLYISARTGEIFVLDFEGKLQRKVKMGFQPFGISPTGDGRLAVMGLTS